MTKRNQNQINQNVGVPIYILIVINIHESMFSINLQQIAYYNVCISIPLHCKCWDVIRLFCSKVQPKITTAINTFYLFSYSLGHNTIWNLYIYNDMISQEYVTFRVTLRQIQVFACLRVTRKKTDDVYWYYNMELKSQNEVRASHQYLIIYKQQRYREDSNTIKESASIGANLRCYAATGSAALQQRWYPGGD